MTLDYIEYIPSAERAGFIARLNQIASLLSIKANDLMTVFFAESKVNPKAYNASSGASGIIQFLPSTAASLGTTTAAIRSMTATKQLDFVYKYYSNYKAKISNVYDTYFAVFYPVAIGKANSYVLFRKGSTAYSQNAGLDVNKDGIIDVSDVKAWFGKYIKTNTTETSIISIIFIVAIIFIIKKYFYDK